MVPQVTRQGNANQCVGDDEAVGRQRAQPAVDVQTAGPASRQHSHRQDRGDAGDDNGAAGSMVAGMSGAEPFMGEPVVRHAQQYASRGGDAGQSSGEQAHQCSNVDEQSKNRHTAHLRDHVHGGFAFSQILAHGMKSQYFRVRAYCEENSGQYCGLNHRARNRLQRVACFRAQRGRAFKTNKAEQRQYQAEPESAAGHATQVELIAVQVPAVTE